METIVFILRTKIPSGQSLHNAVALGKRHTASEALAAGIVHEVCPKSEMFSKAVEWIHKTVPPNGYNRNEYTLCKRCILSCANS